MSLLDVSEFIKLIPDSCSVMQIVCTDRNTFVLTTSGKIYSWGELTFALGRKPKEEKDLIRPMLLYKIEQENIVNIACGSNHVLALTSDRKLFSWGDNKFGQLGHGDTLNRIEPDLIKEINGVVRISAGPEFSVALVEKADKSILTYIWGNNNQIKLRKVNDEEQIKSVVPIKVLQPAWGSQNPQVTIKSNKRGKNYAFKSIVSNEVEMGNLTKSDVEIIQTENSNLLRRFEILSQRAKEYEEKVYECDLSADAGGITEDPVLESIIQILKQTNQNNEFYKSQIKKKKKDLRKIEAEISSIEKTLKILQQKEESSRENIEKLEDDIKYFDYDHDKNSIDDKKLLAILKNNVIAATEEFSKICDDKTKKQKYILEENDKSTQIKDEINKLYEQSKEADRRAAIFTKVKSIRKEQLIYNFFEHSQKAVNKEIDNMESIYEIVKDSEIESISKNLQKNNLTEYIENSLHALDHLVDEIEMMKKPEKPKKNKKVKEMEKKLQIQKSIVDDEDSETESAKVEEEKKNEKKKKVKVKGKKNQDETDHGDAELGNEDHENPDEETKQGSRDPNTKKEYLDSKESLSDPKEIIEEERINFVYKKLNIIWNALEKFILLTKEKNTLTFGLLQETVHEVCQGDLDDEESETEEIGDKRELMKKILSKSKLSKTMTEMENKKK